MYTRTQTPRSIVQRGHAYPPELPLELVSDNLNPRPPPLK